MLFKCLPRLYVSVKELPGNSYLHPRKVFVPNVFVSRSCSIMELMPEQGYQTANF